MQAELLNSWLMVTEDLFVGKGDGAVEVVTTKKGGENTIHKKGRTV